MEKVGGLCPSSLQFRSHNLAKNYLTHTAFRFSSQTSCTDE